MRRLLLLRHAKSDWSGPGQRDHERSLATRGRDAAPRIGAYLAKHGLIPDRVLCSTAKRTRETWDLVAKGLNSTPPTTFKDDLYDAEPETIIGLVSATSPKVSTLLVIGHNPGIHESALRLVATGDIEARTRLNEKYPTAGLAVIDFAFDDWAKLHPESGRLDRFVVPRMLADVID